MASHSIAYVDTRLSPQWRESLHAAGATELTSDLGLPFPTRYSPHLGPDRAAQLVAAWYAQQFPAVVLSLGTAYTLDYLDAEGRHVEGSSERGYLCGFGLWLALLGDFLGYSLPLRAPCWVPTRLKQCSWRFAGDSL